MESEKTPYRKIRFIGLSPTSPVAEQESLVNSALSYEEENSIIEDDALSVSNQDQILLNLTGGN